MKLQFLASRRKRLAAGNVIALIDPLMIFSDTRQCLHDRLAKTIVLDVK